VKARTYVTVIQAAEGYPSDAELPTLEETPARPVLHAVVMLDDHEKLEAEVERLRETLNAASEVLGRGIPDYRKLATLRRIVDAAPASDQKGEPDA
jgi:hypothetical protein